MRNKIIAVNAVIVLLVGLLAFAIVRTELAAATTNPDRLKRSAQRDAIAAASKLQLEALRAERWLTAKAAEPASRAAVSRATPEARSDASRQLCDRIAGSAGLGGKPSLVAIVDNAGKMVARNGSDLNRGDDVGSVYPALKEAITKSSPGSDVWTDRGRADQYVASYAPVRDDQNRPAGMIVIGMSLNDAVARASDGANGRGVLLVGANGDLIANNQGASDEARHAAEGFSSEVKSALGTGNVVAGESSDVVLAVAPLEGFGDGKRSAIVAAAPTALLDGISGVPIAILGAMALGILLVLGGGWILGSYISRPIATLEEGLLAILNGQSDKRFELDHAELGGLAFRIDQLLNQLMGVEEDNTDDEGRVSKSSTAASFGDTGDRGGAATSDKAAPHPGDEVDAARLAAEPADRYYGRLYAEYIAAKKALGEPVDHITMAAFESRIQGMEEDASSKHGKPVRYHVQSNGKEVVLLAVPLA